VTHDQDEALEVSDRIIVVNRGRIEQDAPPQDIFNEPATEFVARFVGESNRAEGVVANGVAAWGPFRISAPLLAHGSGARILFRPTDVYVASQSGDGGVPGTILTVQFLGTSKTLEIEMEDGTRLQAQVPSGVAEQSGFAVGKRVYVLITRAHTFAA
jgi:ABC-type Fe3+/spermidine/putrescine transport system ATPase subunit